jgi:hypothetical protein
MGLAPAWAEGGGAMLWAIVVILLILWLLGGPVGAYNVGGLIHLLLLIALVVLVLQLLSGRRVA